MTLSNRLLPILLLASTGLPASCGPPSTLPEGSAVAVRGVVRYAGRLSGPLRVAVYPSFPPRGAPMAQQVFDRPAFPQPFEIAGVPGGRYFVLAIVDTDVQDGDRFHPTRDPGGAYGGYATPLALAVDAASGARGADVDLVDPSDAPPWPAHYR